MAKKRSRGRKSGTQGAQPTSSRSARQLARERRRRRQRRNNILLAGSVIPPGQRADLVVTFDPDFHKTFGPVTRVIWIESNDPDTPVAEVRFEADVQPR